MGKTMKRWSHVCSITAVALMAWAFVTPGRAQSVSPDARIRARSNCLSSVAKVVGIPSGSLKVIRQTDVATGISIDLKVPKATAPWGCLTDRQGKVEDVHFKGSEGAL
jgi:hypothetical protein